MVFFQYLKAIFLIEELHIVFENSSCVVKQMNIVPISIFNTQT